MEPEPLNIFTGSGRDTEAHWSLKTTSSSDDKKAVRKREKALMKKVLKKDIKSEMVTSSI